MSLMPMQASHMALVFAALAALTAHNAVAMMAALGMWMLDLLLRRAYIVGLSVFARISLLCVL